jgi:uncharacterized protein (DUF433 family)
MGGRARIRGMLTPVSAVAKLVAGGASFEEAPGAHP